MIELPFSGFAAAVTTVAHLAQHFFTGVQKDAETTTTRDYIENALNDVRLLHKFCDEADFDATATVAGRVEARIEALLEKKTLEGQDKEWVYISSAEHIKLEALLSDLQQRLLDQAEGRQALFLSKAEGKLFAPVAPAFGATVETAFPLSAEDISEAGKCLAVGRGTACVFHLMRAMEAAVGVLCTKLIFTADPDREWGKLLSDMDAAIEAMPKGTKRNEWSQSHALLYHVKQAWRNDTMHPKQTYTPEQADEVYKAVQVFMSDLAALVEKYP